MGMYRHGERAGARAYKGGLGESPQEGPGAQGRGWSPLKLKGF